MNKSQVVLVCKKLKSFHKGYFNYNNGFYTEVEEVIRGLDFIKEYGDISSVRKVCALYKVFYFEFKKVELIPLMNKETIEYLKTQKEIKQFSNPVLQITRGKILVKF